MTHRMATRLTDVCGDRNNNFNLIRMAAAAAVLVSHAYPVALGSGAREPLEALLGRSLGWCAVAVFFTISGFMIAASFDRAPSVRDWVAARALRLLPGLVIAVTLTAYALGPLVTTLPIGAYLSEPRTLSYVLRNATLVSLQYDLPGVFADLPAPYTLNGSLWTLFHEVVCYGGVLAAGLAGLLRRPRWMAMALVVYAVGYILGDLWAHALPERLVKLRVLSLPFAIGMAFHVWRRRVRLGWPLAVALGLAAIALHGRTGFEEVFVIWLCYTTFVVAYLPKGFVLRYNWLGDYSYGVYIYAFPMQQLAMHLAGPLTPLQNAALAAPATLLCAVLSWRLVEQPALGLRPILARRLGDVGRLARKVW